MPRDLIGVKQSPGLAESLGNIRPVVLFARLDHEDPADYVKCT